MQNYWQMIVKMKKEKELNQKETGGKWHALAMVELKWKKKPQRELM